ncbi:MAG: hypothetical protein EBR82_26600 [Caulobacteraceae bacterium]|nr:hypothetical protein [Caulobacteraceae bacterium]
MAKIDYLNANMVAWVTDDGSYGVGSVSVFDPDMLTDEQWERLANLSDYDRLAYVQAVIDGNGDDFKGEQEEWLNN